MFYLEWTNIIFDFVTSFEFEKKTKITWQQYIITFSKGWRQVPSLT